MCLFYKPLLTVYRLCFRVLRFPPLGGGGGGAATALGVFAIGRKTGLGLRL
jgi:hypothetical protein